MRNDNEDDIHLKDNIKVSIRKNDKNQDTLNTLKAEADKYGYEISELKEKETTQKTTDVIPWDSHWDKPERNENLKKRLKNCEKEPEPEKKRLPKDE